MQGERPIRLLAVLYCGALLGGFNENLMNMALMAVMDEFSIGSVTAQWLVTGYMIVATVVVVCMAFLYQRVRLRPLFFAAAALSLAGSVLGFLSGSFWMLMAARLVQAVGTGILIPLMVNTVLAVAPHDQLGRHMSIGSCTIAFGPAFAPVVCGGLVTALGWRFVFVVPSVAAVALLVAGAVCVRNLKNYEAHLDVLSVVLSAVFLFALSYGLAELTASAAVAAVSLGVAAASVAAFALRQFRIPHPLINLDPVKRLTFWPTLVLQTVAMMSTFSLSVLLPLYFEGALGYTARFAGLLLLAPVLTNAALTLVGGRIVDRFGAWPLLPVGFGVVAVGMAAIAFAAPKLSLPLVAVGALIAYAGVGLIFSPSQTTGLRTLSPVEHPHGVALGSTFIQIAACIGPALYTGILSSVESGVLAAGGAANVACAQGFAAAVVVAAVVAAAGCATALAYCRYAGRHSVR